MSETKFNKSEFIRARPNSKPAEIIAEAEKLGQVISPGMVWTLRSADKRKADGEVPKRKSKLVGTAEATSRKKSDKAAAKPFNKSAFIRRYPNLTAGQIVKKAAALGHTITSAMVYTLRSTDKKSGVKKKVGKKTDKSSRVEQTQQSLSAISGRPSIAFDPSDPNARRFIKKALAAMA